MFVCVCDAQKCKNVFVEWSKGSLALFLVNHSMLLMSLVLATSNQPSVNGMSSPVPRNIYSPAERDRIQYPPL